MERSRQPLATALARLESRWGSAAIRLGNGDRVADGVGPGATGGPVAGSAQGAERSWTHGALALAPAVPDTVDPRRAIDPLAPLARDVVSTGFPALDAILGPGGLPREASAAIRGDVSSGKTTLALRCIAEAQLRGGIAAYLDLTSSLDPLEAVSRGVDLRWLIVLRPSDAAEGFALAGALLAGRQLDLLVVDLPARLPGRHDEPLRRLAAHARRVRACLIVLEPPALPGALHGVLAEATSLRLELDHRAWIRLGRDVVGQQTEVTVAKNRFGAPGRRVELEIHYADDGDRSIATHAFARSGPREVATDRPRVATRGGTATIHRLAHR